MKNVIAVLLFLGFGQLNSSASAPGTALSRIDEWSATGKCGVVLTMGGYVFELERLGQAPVYIRSDNKGVYVSMDSRMRDHCRLPAESHNSSSMELFLDSVVGQITDALKRRGIEQLKEVVNRGKLTEYDSVIFNLVFAKERALAYGLSYSPNAEQGKLLEAIVKDELSSDELKVLENIAVNHEVEPYTAYSSAMILLNYVNDSNKYESILQRAKQRVVDAYANTEPETLWRGKAP